MTISGRTLHGAERDFPHGLTDLGSGTWAWLEPNGSWGETNAGLVVGDGASLLVDTLWDARLAARMLAAVAPVVAGAPLHSAVNTHRDGDHWWGNSVLSPEVEIWTSQPALAEMRTEPPPTALHNLGRLSRIGARLPGRVGRLGRYTANMLGPFDFDAPVPRLPTRSFTGEHRLEVGGRAVRLLHLGPAHTAGDVVVHVPDAGVVYAGDLLFAGVTPVIWAGPASGWVSALDRLLELDADTYVPGHGPLAGRADVQALRGYWAWLIEASDAEFAADPGFGAYRDWLAPERLALNVLGRQRDLTGAGPAPHDPRSRLVMFSQVAELAAWLGR